MCATSHRSYSSSLTALSISPPLDAARVSDSFCRDSFLGNVFVFYRFFDWELATFSIFFIFKGQNVHFSCSAPSARVTPQSFGINSKNAKEVPIGRLEFVLWLLASSGFILEKKGMRTKKCFIRLFWIT